MLVDVLDQVLGMGEDAIEDDTLDEDSSEEEEGEALGECVVTYDRSLPGSHSVSAWSRGRVTTG